MYDTSGNHSVCHAATAHDEQVGRRLSRLTLALARDEERGRIFRNAGEERQMLLMRAPLRTEEAFRRFGLLLGLLPPAAIFWRMFGVRMFEGSGFWLALCVVMNVACCLAGRALAGHLGRRVDGFERGSWPVTFAASVPLGFLWGLGTGTIGGAPAFGLGAFFGAACAIPVGVLAFALFIPLHRLLARGGMIEARHFWPLACGIAGTITALILSPYVFAV